MQDTQTFRWNKDHNDMDVATLEVRHAKREMVLNVVGNKIESVRSKMAELNKNGMYPNEETTKPGGSLAQFIISYSYNIRWQDFRTVLNEILETHSEERSYR